MNNLVSIIMPAFNAGLYIEQSINSVINQTHENWELIIVNDCSTDNTKEICEAYEFREKRIQLINLEENLGVAGARNIAIERSLGKYIAFLDSDDLWKNDKLEKQLQFMNENRCFFVYASYEIINENGKTSGKILKVPKVIDYNSLLKVNSIGCLTVLIDKESIDNIEMPKLKHEDYATWLTVLKKNNIKAYGIEESLAFYRKTPNSISANKLKSILWNWNIYHNYLGYTKLRSSLMLINLVKNLIKKYYNLRSLND